MHVDLVVSSVEYVDVLFAAEWVTTGENAGEPASLEATVFLMPFEFTGIFDHNATNAEVDFAIKYNGSTIFGVGLDATFATASLDDDPINISGYIKFFDVKLKGNIKLKELEAMMDQFEEGTLIFTDPQEFIDALNDKFSAAIYVDGAKAADLEFAINTQATGEDMPIHLVFVFADGSNQPAMPTLVAIGTEMQEFFTFLNAFYL